MIKYLVVHCSDTPDSRDHTAEDIHRWHAARGWDGIGYHAVIRRTGIIDPGRPEYWPGAHVKGHNGESLGVCLVGRDEFSQAQMLALRELLGIWLQRHPGAVVVGHQDLDDSKTCPNFDVVEWREEQGLQVVE